MLYYFIYRNILKRYILRSEKQVSNCQGLYGRGNEKASQMGGAPFWGDGMFCSRTVMMVTVHWEYTKSHWIEDFKMVNTINVALCEFYKRLTWQTPHGQRYQREYYSKHWTIINNLIAQRCLWLNHCGTGIQRVLHSYFKGYYEHCSKMQ